MQQTEVDADLKALKDLVEAHPNAEEMTEDQVGEMKAAKEKLMASAQKVFEKVYANAQAAQGAAGPDMGSTSAPEDDVVDADYKEV